MIKIAKLHLRNFKSFRKAEIPFADGFTAIVGANASGKSNILDSILFSLGITSLKMLRASKLTELVNSGADEPFARVTIELKDTEKKVNYEITRIIDTQGKGDFRLDGKHVGLNEITTFLLELGIRPDGHNLVVQGDITRVIEMSAKQRREIIDNVAGLAEFDEKKEESLKELERVEQRIRETMIVLRERKAFVDQLSKEKESAEKFVKLQAEMNSCRYTLLQEELKRIRAEIRSAQKGEKEFGEEKAKLAERKSKEKEKREGLAKKLGEIDAKIIAANSIATEGIMKRLEEKRFALGIALERQSAKKEAMQRLGQRLSSLKQRQASLGEEEKSRLAEKSGLEKELELLSRQIGEEEKGIAEARNKFEAERKKSVEAEDRRAKAAEKLDAERKKYYALKEKEAGALAEISATRKMLEEFASDSKRKEIVDAISELAALLKEAGALCAKAGKAAEKAEEKQKKSLLEFAEFGKRLEKRIEAVKGALEGAVNAKAVNEKLKRVSELEKALGQNAKEKALLEKSVLQLEKELGEAAEGTRSGKALEIRTQLPKGLVEKRTNLLTNIAIIGSRLSSSIRDERKAIGIEIAEIEAETEKHQKDSAESETPPIEEQRRGLEKLEAEYEKTKRENESVLKQKREVQETLAECEREREGTEKQLGECERKENELKLGQSRNIVRESDLEEELKSFKYAPEEVKGKTTQELRRRLSEIESEISGLGAINMKALEMFEQYRAEIAEVNGKVETLEREKRSVLEMIEKIEVRRTSVFMECFNTVASHFREIYFSVFEGEGILELTDEANPTQSGLLIEAKHKNSDKLKSIDSMSGGEKTMTALAFLFAIQLYQPAPFYVFDEADSALDKENSRKLAKMIREISQKSQFIAITHNDSIIQEADQIVGVTLNQQKSSVIGLKLKDKIARERMENGGN